MARTRTPRSRSPKPEGTNAAREGTRARKPSKRSAREATRSGPATALAPIVPRRVRQLALLGLLLGSAYASVALASWDPADPGFSTTGGGVVENVAGPVGAWVADVLFHLMGYGAWAIAAVGVLAGVKLAGRSLGGGARVLAAVGLLWTAQTALALVRPASGAPGTFPAGGLIGEGSAVMLGDLVGVAGAWIVLLGVAMAGITYTVRVDWERVFGAALGRAEAAVPVVGALGARFGRNAGARLASARGALAERLAARAEADPSTAWEDEEDEVGWEEDDPSLPPSVDEYGAGPDAGASPRAVDFHREPELVPPTSAPTPRPMELGPHPTPVADLPPRPPMGLGIPGPAALGIAGPGAYGGEYADAPEDRTVQAGRALVEVEWEGTATGAVPVEAPAYGQPPVYVEPAHVPVHAEARAVAVDPPTRADLPARAVRGTSPQAARAAVAARPAPPSDFPPPLAPPRAPAPVADDLEDDFEDEDDASEGPSVAPPPDDLEAIVPKRPTTPVGDLPPLAAQDAPEPPALRLARRRAAQAIQVDPDALVSGGSNDGGRVVIDHGEDEGFELPHLGLLDTHERSVARVDEAALQALGEVLEQKLADFGVEGEVVAIRPGPVITTFEYSPAPGIKLSKIAALEDDIAMALKALRVRIVAPIPGKGVVGFEVPNRKRQVVWIRDLLASESFRAGKRALPMILGKNVEGKPEIGDLAKAPHLLVAGTTGSGKSVGVNTMLMSMLYTRTPDELRLILIDPKMLEFELYQDIPHLLHPVVTDPALANAALKWACAEMDDRYRLLARWQTRSIAGYNKKVDEEMREWTPAKARKYAPLDWPSTEPPPAPRKLPYIVIVIDELADLMMLAAKEVEVSIARIAQKARAAGIHLIVATQRPEKQVVTGIIKANMPSRIAFQVRSKLDGRIILDQGGAEALLGKGDMLFLPPGTAELVRAHGPFVSDDEVRRVCDFLRDQGAPDYEAEIRVEDSGDGSELSEEDYDELYDEAVNFVLEEGKASTSMVQRQFKIGYNRAARIIDVMEKEGVVGAADGARPRKVLIGNHAMGT